jgi:hypothetical protein
MCCWGHLLSRAGKAHVPSSVTANLASLGRQCHARKLSLLSYDLREREFVACAPCSDSVLLTTLATAAVLHSLEGAVESQVAQALCLSEKDSTEVWCDTGLPVGLRPLVLGYDHLTDLPWPEGLSPEQLIASTRVQTRRADESERAQMRCKLMSLFSIGPGAKLESADEEPDLDEDDEEEGDLEDEILNRAIPPQTFLEELAQQLGLHPISIYWLLQEGIEREGWRCLPEEQRLTEDRFTVTVLRLLGHRWPKQLRAGEALPHWADQDGVIPVTSGGETPLIERVRERLAEESAGGNLAPMEREFEEIVGVSLQQWLSGPFFERHISQFKKRPIAWQLETDVRGQMSEVRGQREGQGEEGRESRAGVFVPRVLSQVG